MVFNLITDVGNTATYSPQDLLHLGQPVSVLSQSWGLHDRLLDSLSPHSNLRENQSDD